MERDGCFSQLCDAARDIDQVIEPGRLAILYFNVLDNKQSSRLFSILKLLYTQVSEPFGTATLEELQVIGIVNNAARIGILVIYANRHFKRTLQVCVVHESC